MVPMIDSVVVARYREGEAWWPGGESAGDAVVRLLERCWPSVAELAAKLHQHGKVSHAEFWRRCG